MSLTNLKTIETISLDFYQNNIKTINVKQLDMKSRYVKISCTEHGKMIMLDPNTQSAFVRCKKPDGFSVLNECTISSDGTLLLELTQQMIAVPGKCTVDIMLFYTNLISECTDGDVELSEEGVTLNGLSVTDDNAGNVSVFADETSDFTIQKYTAETIEDIYKLNVPVLSTMTFYLNILPTAIEHTEIESSYEYDALVNGMKNQELIEEHMKNLDTTLNDSESERQNAESARQTAEKLRENKTNEALTACNTATTHAIQATNDANAAANSANAIITAAQTATTNANNAADNANTAATSANAVTEKCQEIIDSRDIANNLTTETVGMVLDATQGKILNDLISSLEGRIDTMHNVYSGTEDPNVADPEGSKDGDVYMLIIEDSTETVGE